MNAFCSGCGAQYDAAASFCPTCGQSRTGIAQQSQAFSPGFAGLHWALHCCMVIITFGFYFPVWVLLQRNVILKEMPETKSIDGLFISNMLIGLADPFTFFAISIVNGILSSITAYQLCPTLERMYERRGMSIQLNRVCAILFGVNHTQSCLTELSSRRVLARVAEAA